MLGRIPKTRQTLTREDIIDEGLNDKTQTLAREDIIDEGLNDKTHIN